MRLPPPPWSLPRRLALEDVTSLPYFNAVISEALRMYPSLPISSGRCVRVGVPWARACACVPVCASVCMCAGWVQPCRSNALCVWVVLSTGQRWD